MILRTNLVNFGPEGSNFIETISLALISLFNVPFVPPCSRCLYCALIDIYYYNIYITLMTLSPILRKGTPKSDGRA